MKLTSLLVLIRGLSILDKETSRSLSGCLSSSSSNIIKNRMDGQIFHPVRIIPQNMTKQLTVCSVV